MLRFEWIVKHTTCTQKTRVFVPFETKHHQSFPDPDWVGFVPKYDQTSPIFVHKFSHSNMDSIKGDNKEAYIYSWISYLC